MVKKILLFMFFILPMGLLAQEEQKYLAGAVPIVDGKVVLERKISVPNLSRDQIFDIVLNWANARYNVEEKRVVYKDKEKGQIAVMGNEYIVFSSSFLSLDRATIKYKLVLSIEGPACRMEISSIRYEYNVSYQDEPEVYLAEKWITDEYALNKDKLARASGKFRKGTIDLIDNLANELKDALGTPRTAVPSASTASVSIPGVKESTVAPVQSAVAPVMVPPVNGTVTDPAAKIGESPIGGQAPAGYRSITPDKIPGNIIKMMSEDWMLITAGNSQAFNMMTASWGALGFVFDKPAFFCFINPQRYTYSLMEKNDLYTLTFYTEAYRNALQYCGSHSGADEDKVKGSGLTPITLPSGSKAFSEAWMIIECRKIMSQPLNADSFNDETLRKEWSQKLLNKMFIGEIVNVWIK